MHDPVTTEGKSVCLSIFRFIIIFIEIIVLFSLQTSNLELEEHRLFAEKFLDFADAGFTACSKRP